MSLNSETFPFSPTYLFSFFPFSLFIFFASLGRRVGSTSNSNVAIRQGESNFLRSGGYVRKMDFFNEAAVLGRIADKSVMRVFQKIVLDLNCILSYFAKNCNVGECHADQHQFR
jgi:hypothetical protein